jgi:hypothetical protein
VRRRPFFQFNASREMCGHYRILLGCKKGQLGGNAESFWISSPKRSKVLLAAGGTTHWSSSSKVLGSAPPPIHRCVGRDTSSENRISQLSIVTVPWQLVITAVTYVCVYVTPRKHAASFGLAPRPLHPWTPVRTRQSQRPDNRRACCTVVQLIDAVSFIPLKD